LSSGTITTVIHDDHKLFYYRLAKRIIVNAATLGP